MILGEEATFTGCLVSVRLLGIIEADQRAKGSTMRNDRLIGATETPKIRPEQRSLSDLSPKVLDQIEQFFIGYNRLEGREFVPLQRRGPKVAARRVDRAIREYAGSRPRPPR